MTVRPAPVHDDVEIEAMMAELARAGASGIVVMSEPFAVVHRESIIAAAARHRLPAVYADRRYVAAGGLMSYGVDPVDLYRRSADYVDRILNGAKPSELPVQTPTKFELVINLKTAKELGITVAPTLLATVDEVIE
jgi:putative ABC transport system substrate-binding protein